jgi:hypothetical protein
MTAWTDFVRSFARKHSLSYGCAISKPECSREYRQKMGMKPKAEKERDPSPPPKKAPYKVNPNDYVPLRLDTPRTTVEPKMVIAKKQKSKPIGKQLEDLLEKWQNEVSWRMATLDYFDINDKIDKSESPEMWMNGGKAVLESYSKYAQKAKDPLTEKWEIAHELFERGFGNDKFDMDYEDYTDWDYKKMRDTLELIEEKRGNSISTKTKGSIVEIATEAIKDADTIIASLRKLLA